MKAYKIWHDEKHYIRNDSKDQLNIVWTTNPKDAMDIKPYAKAYEFYYEKLGFNPAQKYDRLYLGK